MWEEGWCLPWGWWGRGASTGLVTWQSVGQAASSLAHACVSRRIKCGGMVLTVGLVETGGIYRPGEWVPVGFGVLVVGGVGSFGCRCGVGGCGQAVVELVDGSINSTWSCDSLDL